MAKAESGRERKARTVAEDPLSEYHQGLVVKSPHKQAGYKTAGRPTRFDTQRLQLGRRLYKEQIISFFKRAEVGGQVLLLLAHDRARGVQAEALYPLALEIDALEAGEFGS